MIHVKIFLHALQLISEQVELDALLPLPQDSCTYSVNIMTVLWVFWNIYFYCQACLLNLHYVVPAQMLSPSSL